MAPAMATEEMSEAKVGSIPVLDLSRCGEEDFLHTVRKVCEDLGCFQIVNHGIAADLLSNADLVCRDVFKLPKETKIKNVSPVPYAGYVGGVNQTVIVQESLGIAGVPNPEAIREFSHILWPRGNENFCKIMEEYTYETMELSKRVHQIILASFGVSKYYASQFDHGKTIFRMNIYDVLSEVSTEITGVPCHTDTSSITILYEDETGGLQVLNQEGNWVDVKPIPNSFVIFMGDSFQAWTNGRVHTVKHRVMMRKKNARLSLALFCTFPDDMEIKSPPELIDDEHPQLYKVFQYGDMIKERLEAGGVIEEPLHSFIAICGQ